MLLDPVYTGKIMAGLIGEARKGFFKPGENLLFLHTGGLPSLHAYEPQVLGKEPGRQRTEPALGREGAGG